MAAVVAQPLQHPQHRLLVGETVAQEVVRPVEMVLEDPVAALLPAVMEAGEALSLPVGAITISSLG